MPEIYNALPGIEVPVERIAQKLSQMWSDTAAQGGVAPAVDNALATQVNLVLHFGLGAQPTEALEVFRSAVRFSARYPSRIVVLCPLKEDGGTLAIRAKIYGECFPGKTRGDARCCEFVLLSYSMAARRYLENQVSICLAPDLPLYYWAHRFTACSRLADYQYLLQKAKRFIFDRGAAPENAQNFPWPRPDRVRDLACARMLPVRQSLGQFFARYSPGDLVRGLTGVTLAFEPQHEPEGRALLDWFRDRLRACGSELAPSSCTTALLPSGGGTCFELRMEYEDGRHFRWRGNCDTGEARFASTIAGDAVDMPGHISMLDTERTLAEALFF